MPGFTVDDMVRVESALDPSFSPDGARVAFRANPPGVPQVYVVDASGGEPRQLTDTGGVIYGLRWRPGHDEVLYIADDGGDEQFQLHLVDVDSGAARPLASAPLVIHNLGAWSADGRHVSYASNKRERAFFDVYVLDVDSGEERLVLRQDGMNSAGRFSPDGRYLLISRPSLETTADDDLFLADLEAGAGSEPRLLTDHEGVAQWLAAHVHPGGAVLALSDEDREFIGLQRIDLESGEREFLLTPDWDIEALALSRDGARLAVVVNEDGYSHLEVYEVTADARLGDGVRVPDLPRGVISGLSWRPDGSALACTFQGPRHFADVWVADLEAGEVRQLTHSATHGVPVDSFPEPRLVRFPSFDGRQIPAFYYMPEGSRDGPVPCMIYVHGGPESQSRPTLWASSTAPLFYLLTQGVALLVTNVRGSTGYGKEYAHADDVERRMDSVRDLVAAVDWLASTGEVDPQRVGVLGGSYGGFMVLAAITEAPERWAAAVDLFGIANFETFLKFTGAWRRKQRAAEYGDDPEFLRTISPIHKADRIRAPLLVIQGDHDVRVPQEESEQIVETVRRNEGVVEYVIFPDEGHGIQRLPHRLELARRTVAFLEEHLVRGGVRRE